MTCYNCDIVDLTIPKYSAPRPKAASMYSIASSNASSNMLLLMYRSSNPAASDRYSNM